MVCSKKKVHGFFFGFLFFLFVFLKTTSISVFVDVSDAWAEGIEGMAFWVKVEFYFMSQGSFFFSFLGPLRLQDTLSTICFAPPGMNWCRSNSALLRRILPAFWGHFLYIPLINEYGYVCSSSTA